MNINNLVQLVRATKPRTALFTTYTLSLSFFEAVLLPVLRQVGCHDVAILVDANEAVASLAEAHVNYAGRRYWVAPVIAPGGGVFHLKLTYLTGGETDVLAVGSGNLTLPGQSGQLETLDAVSSSSAPGVFTQFSELANSLAGKIDKTSKQAAELLREYGARASSVALKEGLDPSVYPDAPFLIHSVDRPASEQIVELWRLTKNDANAVTVLSPFHAPDAGPIDRLAENLEVGLVSVGLDPKTLIAPFDQKRFKVARKVRYVVPTLEVSVRRLHGKVFEISGSGGTLVISGSINATQQSLESIKNVEASLARWLPSPCFEWSEAKPARFEPNSYVFEGHEPDFAFLDASLESNGTVHGRLSGIKTIPASATVNILRADVPLEGKTRTVDIGATGEFSSEFMGELTSDGAVQLELTASGVRATCWLNVTEELVSSDEDRREKQCVRHILRGDFKSDDVAALLQILCRAASFGSSPKLQLTQETAEPIVVRTPDGGERPFSYLQWQMSGRLSRERGGLLGVRYDDTLKAFVRWLNTDVKKVLPPAYSEPPSRPQQNQAFSDLAESQEPREGVDIENLLRQLIEAIPQLLSEHPDADYADLLASVAGAHALKLMLTSTWTDERRLSPALVWLDAFSRYAYRETARQALQPIALGVAMVTAASAKARNLVIPGSLLKESLLRFGLSASDSEYMQGMVKQALEDEVFSRVDEELRLQAAQVCDEVWTAESVNDRLVRLVVTSRESKAKSDVEDEALFPDVLASLRTHHPIKGKPFRDGVLTQPTQLLEGRGCPHCYQSLDDSMRRALRARHAAVCKKDFCGKVIFYLEDPAVANRIKGALTNV
jgi:hypothetical protein